MFLYEAFAGYGPFFCFKMNVTSIAYGWFGPYCLMSYHEKFAAMMENNTIMSHLLILVANPT